MESGSFMKSRVRMGCARRFDAWMGLRPYDSKKHCVYILEPGMKVYNLDLPGHGKAKNQLKCGELKSLHEQLSNLFAQLNICRPVLIGHSFGDVLLFYYLQEMSVRRLVPRGCNRRLSPKRSLRYY